MLAERHQLHASGAVTCMETPCGDTAAPTNPHHHAPMQRTRRYEEDIKLAQQSGCNAFRLSIEWARLEPRRGYIDLEAVAR